MSDLVAAHLSRTEEMITGVILAGGQGRRMGSVDKGLQPFRGEPMAAAVLRRFAPQVAEVLINANRNRDEYARFGYPVIADSIEGFAGPLAGLYAGLSAARHELVATTPCDSPLLPLDLVARLHSSLIEARAQLAVAKTFSQVHPVFCLCRRDLLAHLAQFLQRGGRKIDAWYAALVIVEVTFDDQPQAFINVNTPEELGELERGAH